jgi:hypothetical protein
MYTVSHGKVFFFKLKNEKMFEEKKTTSGPIEGAQEGFLEN